MPVTYKEMRLGCGESRIVYLFLFVTISMPESLRIHNRFRIMQIENYALQNAVCG